MYEANAHELEGREKARIIKTAVTPRPIAWISSVDASGHENLAPFSSYNYANLGREENPVVLFNSTVGPSGAKKDTVNNAIETEEFAVNIVTADLLEPMDRTAAKLDPHESEFEVAGLESAPCRTITAPRVADAAVTLECTLYDTHDIHDSIMVLGEVQYFHVDEAAMIDGKIDSRTLDTVGRLGGPFYTISDPVEYERQY